jgi:dihydropteroate synthase
MKLHFPKVTVNLTDPKVMGVLNITPDSFSDGGRYVSVESALRQTELMIKEGATFIDVGGESTRPGASPVSEIEELERVCPVVEAIASRFNTIISIDTSTPQVMREGVKLGAQMINDIRSLERKESLQVVADLNIPVCLMHMQGSPQTMQLNPSYTDIVKQVKAFFINQLSRAVAAGITRENLIIDPGFGFGKRLDHNLELLKSLDSFSAFNLPVLVGVSRKSMLGAVTGREVDERLAASLAAATIAVYNGAQIIRAHDVAVTVDAIKVAAAVRGEMNE